MKTAFFEIQGNESSYLKQTLGNVFISNEPLTVNNAVKDAEVISVFIYSKIDKAILDKMPKLKLIATRSTGFDHIDLKECKKRKIIVCNVPSYGENTVAEHTFALLLSLSRNIHKAYVQTLKEDHSIEKLQGFDLKGKTIGIIGLGKIGSHVARIAKGFGMNIIVFSEFTDENFQKQIGFKYVKLDELLSKSDIITLHVPLTKETFHMISMKNVNKIKKGAILINTARGPVVELEALLYALDKKILSGAGLDVIEGDELIKEEKELLYTKSNIKSMTRFSEDHLLMHNENVVFTPHIAFYSKEALQRIIETTVNNIICFEKNKTENAVNTN